MASDPRHHYHHDSTTEKKSRTHRHSPSSSTSSDSDSEYSSSSTTSSSSSSYRRRSGDAAGASVSARQGYGKREDKKRTRSKGGSSRKGGSSTSGERPKSKKVKSAHKRSSSSKGHSSRKSHSSKKEYKDYEYTSSGSKVRSSSSSHHHHQGGTAAVAAPTPSLSTLSHHHSHHHHHHHRSSKQGSNGSTAATAGVASSSSSSYKRAGVRALSPPLAVGVASAAFAGGTTSSSSRKSRKSSPSGKSSRRKSSSRDRGGSSAVTASGEYRTVSLASSAFATRSDESSRPVGSAVTSRRGLVTSPDRYGDVYDHHSSSPHHHTQQHHHHTLVEHQQQHHKSSSSSSSKREHHSTSSPMHHHSASATAATSSRHHHTFDDPRTERDVYKALHRQDDSGDKGRGSKYSRGEHEFLRNHEVVLPSSRDDLERASSSELQQEYYEGKSGRERGSSYDRYSVGRTSSSRLDPSSYSPHSHAAAYDKHHDKYYDKYSDKYQAYEKSSSSYDKHQDAYDKNYDAKALPSSYDKGDYDKSLSHLCDKPYEKQELYDKSYHQHYEKRSKRESSYGEEERSAGRSDRGVAVGDHYSESRRDIASDPWHEDDLLQHDPLPHHLSSHHHHQRGGSSRSPPSSHRQPLPPSEHAIGGGGGGGIQARLSDPAKIHSHHQQQQQPSSSQLPQSPHGLPPPPHHHPPHNQPPPGMQQQQQHPSPLTQQQLQQPPPHPHHQPLGPPPPQMAQPPQMHPPPHQFGVPMNQGPLQGGGSVGGLGGPIAPPPSHQQQFNQPPPQSGPPNIRGGTLSGGPNIRGPSGGPGISPGGPNNLRAPNVGPNIRGSLVSGGAMSGPSNVRGAPSGHNIRGPNGPPFRGRGEWMGGPPGRGAMHGGPPLQWDRNEEFADEYGEGGWGGGVGGGAGDGSVNQGGEWADQSKRIMHPPPSGPHVGGEGGGWGPTARLGPRDGGMVRPPLGDQGPPHFLRPPPVNLNRPPPPTPTRPGMGGPGMARPSTLLPPHPPPARHPQGPGESPQKRLEGLQGGSQNNNVLLSGLGRGLSGRLGGPPNLSSPPPNMSKPPPATPMQLNKPPPQFPPKQQQHQQPLPPGDSPTGGNSPNDGSNGEREGESGAGNNDLLDDIEQLSDFSDDADDLLNRDAGGPVEEPLSATVAATTVTGQGPAIPAAVAPSQSTPSAGMISAAADAQQQASPSASLTAAAAACITDLFEDEETMDLEEISDDDLEDERQAKFTVCDALTINWTALATAERPSAATSSSGGVMERFSAASILARIGVSSRYARPSVVGRVLSACGACPGVGLQAALPHCTVPRGGHDGVEKIEIDEQESTAGTTIANQVVKIEPDSGNLTDHEVDLSSEQLAAQGAASGESGLQTTSDSTKDTTCPAGTDEAVDATTAQDGANNRVGLPTAQGDSVNANDYDDKETKKLMAAVDAGGHSSPVLVPAVVCDSGVVSLLRFRPGPILAVKHDADGFIDNKQLLKEEHDVPIITPSEEILLLGPHSVALSAYQDIRIRQELCRTNTLGQLLTVHTLPHQRAC